MSFGDDLLVILSSYSGGYKLMRRRMMGDSRNFQSASSRPRRESSDQTMRVTLSRLKKRGLAENKDGIWKITKEGLARLAEKVSQKNHPVYEIKKNGPKNMVIAFDIPESRRHARNWLRVELVNLGFVMLQKSVWFGPAPLPKAFTDVLKELRIVQHLKFFEAKEADIV